MKYSQDVQDRAREWVNNDYPGIKDDAEYEFHFLEACQEIVELDAFNDREDAQLMGDSYDESDRYNEKIDKYDVQESNLNYHMAGVKRRMGQVNKCSCGHQQDQHRKGYNDSPCRQCDCDNFQCLRVTEGKIMKLSVKQLRNLIKEVIR